MDSRLEPDVSPTNGDKHNQYLQSIAISLKRIADAVERVDPQGLHSYITNLAYDAGISFHNGNSR